MSDFSVFVSDYPLTFAGRTFAAGEPIPSTVDPAQLAYFARVGVTRPTTAPDTERPVVAPGLAHGADEGEVDA